MKRLMTIILCCIAMTTTVFAAEQPITKTYEYSVTANSESDMETQTAKLVPATISENDVGYHISDFDTSVTKSEPIKTTETKEKKIVFENLYTKNATPAKEVAIEENGENIMLELADLTYEEAMITGRTKTVTAYTVWENKTNKPNIPQRKTTAYQDKESGQTVDVTVDLKKVTTTDPKWVSDVKIPVVFKTDSLYYNLNGKIVPYNPDKPVLKGYENDILDYLKLDKSKYRITDMRWDGGFYNADGVQCRNAIATGQRLVNTYRADYESNVRVPDAKGYKATAVYTKDIERETGITEYKVKVTATYSPDVVETKKSIVPTVVMTVGIMLAIILAIAILAILSKRQKKEEE